MNSINLNTNNVNSNNANSNKINTNNINPIFFKNSNNIISQQQIID